MILARDDLRTAGNLAEHDRDRHNSTYHASQSVAKALKGAQVAAGLVHRERTISMRSGTCCPRAGA